MLFRSLVGFNLTRNGEGTTEGRTVEGLLKDKSWIEEWDPN